MQTEWVDIIALDSLEPNDVTPVLVGRRQLAIYDSPTGIYATDGLCSHAGAPLCDGYFDGHIIECPLHQGGFDIRNGKALYPPVVRNINTYPVKVEKGRVLVELPAKRFR